MSNQTSSPKRIQSRNSWLAGVLIFGSILGAALVWLAMGFDGEIKARVLGTATPGVTKLARLVSRYGDWPWLLGPVLAAWIWAKFTSRVQLKSLLGMMLATFLLAGLTGLVTRVTTGRARPSTTEAQGWYGLKRGDRWLVGAHEYNSFPSGHTTAAAGMAGVLVFARRRWGWVAQALPITVGWSRITLNSHHFSDVVAGCYLGLLAGWIVWNWKSRDAGTQPAPGPGYP